MTSSYINEPFTLATYASTSRSKTYIPGIFVSLHKKSNDEYATVATNGDGVHVLDVADLHPIISHTLGPSTSFSCPPLTISTSTNVSKTYAVIAASPELSSPGDANRTIWMWEDDLSLREKQKEKRRKTVFSAGRSVYGLHSCGELPGRILALSSEGELSLLDAESLDVKMSHTPKSQSNILHIWVFSRNASSFCDTQRGAVLVLLTTEASKTTIRLLAIDEADSISELQEYDVAVSGEAIVSASCSDSGILSILLNDGGWSAYQVSLTLPLEKLSSNIHLSNLTFSTHSVSILALTSSHVLLVAISSHEVILHVWDLQFAVLLVSHVAQIPSSLSSSALHLQLISHPQLSPNPQAQTLGQAVLILSSIPSLEKQEVQKSTSVLLVVPYSVPSTSTIAAAIGRGGLAKKWLRAPPAFKTESADDVSKKKMLDTMRAALQGGRAQAAEATFMKWAQAGPTFDYNSVKEVLEVVLLTSSDAQTAAAKVAYASEVVHYLLEKQVVCSAMVPVPGGLLGALRARGDWKSIEVTFDKVQDLTETEIVETLRVVIAYHRQTTSGDGMQVDSQNSDPITPLPLYLNLLTTYSTSHGPLLLAFRRYLQEPEDITAILKVLDGWVSTRTKMEERLLPTKKDMQKSENGVWVIVGRRKDRSEKKKREDVPPLEKVANLLQTLLDASFLSLVSHKPAHKILRSLSEHVNPEIAFALLAESIRGPLEPFSVAQDKAIKESLVSPQEREKEKQKVDWRQRKKSSGVDIGVYTLEELVL